MEFCEVWSDLEEEKKKWNAGKRMELVGVEKRIDEMQVEFRQRKREAFLGCQAESRKLLREQWSQKKFELWDKIRKMRVNFKKNCTEQKLQNNILHEKNVSSIIASIPASFFQPEPEQKEEKPELQLTEELRPFYRYLLDNPGKKLQPTLSSTAQESLLQIARSVCPIHRSSSSLQTFSDLQTILPSERTLQFISQYCPCHRKEVPSWLSIACVTQVNATQKKTLDATRRRGRGRGRGRSRGRSGAAPKKNADKTKLETLQRWLGSSVFLAEFKAAKLHLVETCQLISKYTAKLSSLHKDTEDTLVKRLKRLLFVILNENGFFLILRTLRKSMVSKVICITLPPVLTLGVFIGKSGSNLKQLQEKTGVSISVLNAARHTGNVVEISLKGLSQQKCDSAKANIMELVDSLAKREQEIASKKGERKKKKPPPRSRRGH